MILAGVGEIYIININWPCVIDFLCRHRRRLQSQLGFGNGHDEETGGERKKEMSVGGGRLRRAPHAQDLFSLHVFSGPNIVWIPWTEEEDITSLTALILFELCVGIEEMELLIESKVTPAATFHQGDNQLGEI